MSVVVYKDSDGDTFTRWELIKATAILMALVVCIGLIGHFAH